MLPFVLVFVLVALPMLVEARRAARNERSQRTRGGVEPEGDVYPLMQVAYPGAFLAMLLEGFLRGAPPQRVFVAGLVVFVLAKALKWWAISALGSSWTFRVIVVPGVTLTSTGPYRWVQHPNYVAVLGEFTGVALMTGAVVMGPIGTLAFGLLIWQRVRVEQRALGRRAASENSPSAETTALDDLKTVLPVVVTTRAAILLVAYLAVVTFGFFPGGAPNRVSDNELLNLQSRFDTGWYLGIAMYGYGTAPTDSTVQQPYVFFPGLPLLMRIAAVPFGASALDYLWGGTFVVLVAFTAALVYLLRLARDLLDDEEQARYALWLVATYPFAVFFGAVYTESLFLLGVAGAFYHFRRGEFARAGAWGLFTGFLRPNGFFLAGPLLVLAASPWLPGWLIGGRSSVPRRSSSHVVTALCAASMPIVAVLLHSAFMWRLTGNSLAWLEGQRAWGREYLGLVDLVMSQVDRIRETGLYAYSLDRSILMINASGALFALASVLFVARRLGLAYTIFVLINILPPLLMGGFEAIGRFSSVLFPAHLWLASITPPAHRPAWLSAGMALQALIAALFYTWRPIY